MGMTTYIYGFIREYGLNSLRLVEVKRHNNRILAHLPLSDNWPPLTRNMFAATNNHKNESPGSMLEYTGRLIHFGASTKSIEHEWMEWQQKFERLLTSLYWLEATVHVKTELNDIDTFNWSVDLRKWSIGKGKIQPLDHSCWIADHPKTWYNQSTK